MSQPHEVLRRRYGLLLLAYPRGYRAARSTEMLTTLLEAAEPARRTPALRDAVDLIVGGVRYRLSVPRRPLPVISAVLAALVTGLVVSAAAGLLAWHSAVTQPSASAAAAAFTAASGRTAPAPVADFADPLSSLDVLGKQSSPGEEGHRGPAPAPATLHYGLDMGDDPAARVAERAQRNLEAAGWTTGGIVPWDRSGLFWAYRGDMVLRVQAVEGAYSLPGEGSTWTIGDPTWLWVSAHAVAPGQVTVVATTGFVLGALAGWLLCAWLLRAVARMPRGGRVTVLVIGVAGLLGAAGSVLLPAAASALSLGTRDGWSPVDSLLPATALLGGMPIAGFAAGLLLAALVGALFAPMGPDPVLTPPRTGPGAVATISLGAVVVLACLVLTVLGLVTIS